MARHKISTYLAALALFIFAIPLVVKNQSKPLIKQNSVFRRTDDEIRFHMRPSMLPALKWTETVCRDLEADAIALHAQPHSWVYPVQRALSQLPNQPQIFLLKPTFGKRFAVTNAEPDLIVAVDQNIWQKTRAPILKSASGKTFHYVAEYENLRIYLPEPQREKFNLFPPKQESLTE